MTQIPETPSLDYEMTYNRLARLLNLQQDHLGQVSMYQNQAASVLQSLESADMVQTVQAKISMNLQRHLLAAAFIDFMKMDAAGIYDATAQDLLNTIERASIPNDLRLAADRIKPYSQTLIKDPRVFCLSDADLIRLTERITNAGGGTL